MVQENFWKSPLKSYYQTSLPICLIFAYDHLSTLGLFPAQLMIMSDSTQSNHSPISKDIWEAILDSNNIQEGSNGVNQRIHTQLNNDI